MEFEDEHNEDHELEEEDDEDEDDGEEITIPPPPPPLPQPPQPSYDSAGRPISSGSTRSRPNSERRSGAARYRECLKNHAVNIGGHALDGCGEFMPSGEEGSLDALRCAACNCHRNFHRREVTEGPQPSPSSGAGGAFYPAAQVYRTPPPGYIQVPPQHRPLTAAMPSTSGGTHSGEIDDSGGGGVMKKRFRTKFTQEQKDKMLAFAEKLGWRIQKHDEAAVQQFCAEVQIKRQVLKVWMHNNKNTLGKKQP